MGRMGPGQTSMAMCSWMVMPKRFPFRTVIGLSDSVSVKLLIKEKEEEEGILV